MAESTLSLGFVQYMNKLSHSLAMGRDYTALDADEQQLLAEYVNEFYLEFLTERDWSFLEPVTSIGAWTAITAASTNTVTSSGIADDITTLVFDSQTVYPSMIGRDIVITSVGTFEIVGYQDASTLLVEGDATAAAASTFAMANDGTYRLPDNFGGIIGQMTYPDNDGRYKTIEERGEEEIRTRMQASNATGRPELFAIRPLREIFDGVAGQRFDLATWPPCDSTYVLSYKMRLLPVELSATNPYPYGGAMHAQALLYCILAGAHQREDDDNAPGLQQKYQKLLMRSQQLDDEFGAPDRMGKNLDMSDSVFDIMTNRRTQNYYVLYNGVLYT